MRFKGIKQLSTDPKKNWLRLLKIGGVLLAVIVVAEVLVVNRLSTYGNKIQDLNDQKSALELENLLLKNQIAEFNALNNINEKASIFGFENIKKVEHIR